MGNIASRKTRRRFMYESQEANLLRHEFIVLLAQDEDYRGKIRGELRPLWRAVPAFPAEHPGRDDFGVLRMMVSDDLGSSALHRYVAAVAEFVSKTLRLNSQGRPAGWAESYIHAAVAGMPRPKDIPEEMWDDFVLRGGTVNIGSEVEPPELTWNTAFIPILVAVSPAGAMVEVADQERAVISCYPLWWNFPNWDEVRKRAHDGLDRELDNLQTQVQQRLDGVSLRNVISLEHDRCVLVPALVEFLYRQRPRPSGVSREQLRDLAGRIGVDLPRR